MRRLPLSIGFMLAGVLASTTAYAQVLPITFNFSVPRPLDPPTLVIFTAPGTQTVGGIDLIGDQSVPFSAGTEVHSRIPGESGGILDIDALEVQFDYSGQISINPPPGPPTPGYVNWTVQSLLVTNNHYDIVFVSAFQPFSAPINDNFDPGPLYPTHTSFAGLGVTGDPTALAAFVLQNPANNVKISTVTIGQERKGNAAVPEPGAVALFGGAGFTLGGWLLARRRRK